MATGGQDMIEEYAANLAAQMGIELSRVTVVEGKLVGCRDSHLLQLVSGGRTESALIYQLDLENLQHGINKIRLETRLKAALSRLQRSLESARAGEN
jgi:hypothetical protein